MAGLQIRGLCVDYGTRRVIDGLDLDAQPGAFVALLGESGSGKSSLLRAIAGLQAPAAGSVHFGGRALDPLPPGRREIAMVFQDHALLPQLDVIGNLTLGLRARGVGAAEATRQATAAARRLGLEPLLARRASTLSGGEAQRVALGRALLRQAKLVLMDEPLSALDAPLRARLREELLVLHREQGWTTLYVTHDQAEALAMGDQLGLLEGGRLLQYGPPAQVYRRPASLAAARFLGQPPMAIHPLEGEPGAWRWLGQPLPGTLAADQPPGRVLAGLRPEALHVQGSRWQPPRPPDLQWQARVTGVENAGESLRLRLEVDGQRLDARDAPEAGHAAGDTLQLGAHSADLRLFDADSGQALEADITTAGAAA